MSVFNQPFITNPTDWKLRYWSIFIGQALSQLGSAVTQFVLMFSITINTNSIVALTNAGIFAFLPQCLLSPFSGTFADRYSRRKIMIITDIISAICMIILIYLFSINAVKPWHIYTILAIRSGMQAFQGPASQSSTPMLVPEGFLPRASALNQSLFGLITVAAAPIGALALGFMSLEKALLIDVITALTGIIPLFIYHIPQPVVPDDKKSSILLEFKEGAKIIWNNKPLRSLFALELSVSLIIIPSFILIPLLVTQYFKGTAGTIAVMESFAGIGMLLGGLMAVIINPKRLILTFICGLSLSCLTVAFTALTSPKMLWLATIWWFLSGFCYTFGNAPIAAIIQKNIPNNIQGRVFSLSAMMISLASPIGLYLMGVIGSKIGVQGVFIYSGVAASIICLFGLFSKNLFELEKVN